MGRPTKYRKTNKYTKTCPPSSTEEDNLSGLSIALCRPIEATLFSDEIEALKLRNIDNLSQSKIAKKMKISQPTVARILKKAYKKITRALLEQKTICVKSIHPQSIELGPKKIIAIERINK